MAGTRDLAARLSGPAPGRRSVRCPDPDALAVEFSSRNVEFSEPLKDTDDGLRGFELRDADEYVLFFGRPRP